MLKNWCFWTAVLEKTLKSPLGCKEIKPVHPKGDQSWVLIGRTDAEAETPLLWPPHVKSWFIGKDPDPGKDWKQQEKGTTEDEVVDGITDSMEVSLSKLLGDGQGGLVFYHPWDHRVGHDWVAKLNWTELSKRVASF